MQSTTGASCAERVEMKRKILLCLRLFPLLFTAIASHAQKNCSYVVYSQANNSTATCPSQPSTPTSFTNTWNFTYQCYADASAPGTGPQGSPSALATSGAGVCQYQTICSPTETDGVEYAPSVPGQNALVVVTTDKYNGNTTPNGTLSCATGATHTFRGYCQAVGCYCPTGKLTKRRIGDNAAMSMPSNLDHVRNGVPAVHPKPLALFSLTLPDSLTLLQKRLKEPK